MRLYLNVFSKDKLLYKTNTKSVIERQNKEKTSKPPNLIFGKVI